MLHKLCILCYLGHDILRSMNPNRKNLAKSVSSPRSLTSAIPEPIDVHRIAASFTKQCASLPIDIRELELAAGERTLSKWEQKRLHTMRTTLKRYTAALALYTLRFN